MDSKTDMRRPDLVVPYQAPLEKSEAPEFSSTLSSTLPMAAMFMRNKYIAWGSLAYALQNWMGESDASKKNTSTPSYLTVGMSIMSLGVTYLPLFIPPSGGVSKAATGTEAPAPVPLM